MFLSLRYIMFVAMTKWKTKESYSTGKVFLLYWPTNHLIPNILLYIKFQINDSNAFTWLQLDVDGMYVCFSQITWC